MEVYLIRHAHAGARSAGSHDRYRQLSQDGSYQAAALVDFFGGRPVGSILSSPATRCVQTVKPLAVALGLPVVEESALWEDVGLDEIFGLISSLPSNTEHGGIVLCSHGNLIPAVIERLAHRGAAIHGRGCERASIWLIRSVDGQWVEGRYFTPRSGYAG